MKGKKQTIKKEKNLTIDSEKWYGLKAIYHLGQADLFPVRSEGHILGLLRTKKLKGINIQLNSRQVWRVKGKELLRYMGELD